MNFFEKFSNAWNAFDEKNLYQNYPNSYTSYSTAYQRPISYTTERSLINAYYTRVAVDVASINFKHVKVDENRHYSKDLDSSLNDILTFEANKDQSGRELIRDAAYTMLEKGVAVIVPIKANVDPYKHELFIPYQFRIAELVQWYTDTVLIEIYNEQKGVRTQIQVPKRSVGIVTNPLFTTFNSPGSPMKSLINKLNQMDIINNKNATDKLNLLLKLPYAVRSDKKKELAKERTDNLSDQLKQNDLGIGYIDATENITQLNHPIESNLLAETKFCKDLIAEQSGLNEDIMKGTYTEQQWLNYNHRLIEPICNAISEEINRKFISQYCRSQGQAVMYFRDHFKLVPTEKLAELADKFTRNEIMTSNEFRGIIGYKPVETQEANELRNKNLNKSSDQIKADEQTEKNLVKEELQDVKV